MKPADIEPSIDEKNAAKNKEWEKEVRLEIARRRREMFENAHIVEIFLIFFLFFIFRFIFLAILHIYDIALLQLLMQKTFSERPLNG